MYVLSVNYAGSSFGESIAAPPWVGPVPGLATDLAPSSLGIEEGVLPLVVQSAHLAAVRRAYPYRRDVSPTLLPSSLQSSNGALLEAASPSKPSDDDDRAATRAERSTEKKKGRDYTHIGMDQVKEDLMKLNRELRK